MIVEVLEIDQGKTLSVTSEGMTDEHAQSMLANLEASECRFIVFPTERQMLTWRALVEGT